MHGNLNEEVQVRLLPVGVGVIGHAASQHDLLFRTTNGRVQAILNVLAVIKFDFCFFTIGKMDEDRLLLIGLIVFIRFSAGLFV